jgi:DNA-binding MarR family transcriptional regulator
MTVGNAGSAPVLILDDYLPYHLCVCASRVAQEFEQLCLQKYAIGIPEWRVLMILRESGTLTAKQIAQRYRMHKTKVSRAVSLLEERKMLKGRVNPMDRREAFLSLTVHGREACDALARPAIDFAHRLAERIDPADRHVVARAIKKLVEQPPAA